jgi:murein L,D-transpeptidase YafK
MTRTLPLISAMLSGCAVVAEVDPVGLAARLVQGLKSEVPRPASPCLSSTGELTLGPGLSAEDPRLQSNRLIVIRKADRRLQRFSDGLALPESCWRVGLGPAPVGHKFRQGDGRTPEGWYRTSDKPWSQWYAAIAVHYPNAIDAEAGRIQGRISASKARQMVAALDTDKKPAQSTALGGEILIHGQGSSDWTLGCIGMENADIDALRASLPDNMRTDVLILP